MNAVEELIKEAQSIEASIILDDIVHDLKSQEASAINNGGVASQVDYIIEQYGKEKGLEIIRKAIYG
jgi:hypothetical protein